MRRSMQTSGTRTDRRRRGAALAEYGLLLAGITLASLVAVSVLGGKVGGLVASVATLLPGASLEDNGIVQVGALVETTLDSDGATIKLDDQRMLHGKTQGDLRGLGDALGLENTFEASHLYQLSDRAVDE